VRDVLILRLGANSSCFLRSSKLESILSQHVLLLTRRDGGSAAKVKSRPYLAVIHEPETERHWRGSERRAVRRRRSEPRSAAEGKSLSAANVALVLADLPSTTVCLVDADLRRPRQSRLFGVRSGPGLSDYLVEDIRSPDDLVIPTRLENLFLVPAGDQAMIPSAHFGSPRCLDLIHRLRERFHYVLFDTPPVGTFPDAAILASRLDGVILVIRMKKTPRKVVESSVDTLRRAGCHILSTLLTGVDTDKSWYEAYRSR
jgi:capsular exopolysaccharide synthesis family protein